jgi:hypothetical protein
MKLGGRCAKRVGKHAVQQLADGSRLLEFCAVSHVRWKQAPRQQAKCAEVRVRKHQPEQWITVRAFQQRQGIFGASVGSDWVVEWQLEQEEPGVVWIDIQHKEGSVSRCRACVVSEEPEQELWLPRSWWQGWELQAVPESAIVEGRLHWEADVGRLEEPTEGDVAEWWATEREAQCRQYLDPNCDEVGAFLEEKRHEPDVNVLGAWVLARLNDLEGRLPVQHREEASYESNPDWALAEHAAQKFVAGQLHQYREEWRKAGACKEVLDWLADGYPIRVNEDSAEAQEAIAAGKDWKGINKSNGKLAMEHLDEFRLVVVDVLQKGAWAVVEHDAVVNVLPMNVAPKPSKSPPWRLILNCMALNEFVPLWSVRYETLRTVPLVVDQGDWLFSIDFTDAYYQLLVQEKCRELIGARIVLTQQQVQELFEAGLLPEGWQWDREAAEVEVTVQPKGLPMGFRNSCAVWTKTARVLTGLWRRKGFKLVHMIDDLLFSVTGSYEEACSVRDEVCADLKRLGVLVNWKKSLLKPCKCLRFLGMLIDSDGYRFFVPDDKVVKLKALIQQVVSRPEATFRQIASVVGKIMSLMVAVPAVRMLTREAYALVRPEGQWDNSTALTEEVVKELLEVMEYIVKFNRVGNPIRRFIGMTEVRILVDAGTGYGWRVDGKIRMHEFGAGLKAVAAEWDDSGERDFAQCWKELKALQYCIGPNVSCWLERLCW